MTAHAGRHRIRIARGFLEESRQDVTLGRWRSAVDNAQMATEHAAKALLALVGPVARTHNPGALLRDTLATGRLPATVTARVQRVAECTDALSFDVHVRTDYGDEDEERTPWDLFGEEEATQSLAIAEEAVSLASAVFDELLPDSRS
jgi:HEPN domain-containing protein